jgi:hypothetical protein
MGKTMGIDLIGRDRSYNWAGWQQLYETGIKYGWRPKGTLPPGDFDGEWTGTYFSNDFQIVSAEDALAWGEAIERYLATPHAELPENPRSLPPWAFPVETVQEWYADFSRIASSGGLILG